jgi:hypothetical protein
MLSKNEEESFLPVCIPFQHFYKLGPRLLQLKYFPQETKDYTHKLLLSSPLTAVWKLRLLLVIKSGVRVNEKAELCTDFAPSFLTYLLL